MFLLWLLLDRPFGTVHLSVDSANSTTVVQLEAGDDSAAVQLQSCMRKTAALHQKLLSHAKKEGIAVPETEDELEENSQHSGPDTFQWSQYILVGAKDWEDIEDEGHIPFFQVNMGSSFYENEGCA